MMRRRMGRPGLVGTMARTAVIAGTASATAGAVNRHQQAKAQEQADAAAYQQQQAAQYAPPPQQYAPAPVEPAAAPAGDDLITKIQELAQLHQQGILTDAEFAAAKQRLLG
jgi:predicted flap endonuclease-1-like 5' DNA nuclease